MIIQLKDILQSINLIRFEGDKDAIVSEMVAIDGGEIAKNSLLWCSAKYQEKLEGISTGSIIIETTTFEWLVQNNQLVNSVNWIVVEKPRNVFSQILKSFFVKKMIYGNVAESAKIHPSVHVNRETVSIGENVIIEEGVSIGDYVTIGHNTVILKDCLIGNHVLIGNNTTIGGVGFGYEINDEGVYEAIPHIGNVVLKDRVEIGNNVTIDRAVLGATILHENVKVDNLVHIAHGVSIGKNSLIIANSMIAGSCVIGDNVWVSPSVSIIQKAKIGNDSLVGMGSVVIRDVDDSTVVAGVPAKKIKDK